MKRLLLPKPYMSCKLLDKNHPLLKCLKACRSVRDINQTHAQLVATGLVLHPFCRVELIRALSAYPLSLRYANQVFECCPQRNLLLYNTIIRVHDNVDHSVNHSLLLFRAMLRESGLLPNKYTFIYVLSACSNGSWLLDGSQVHVHTVKHGLGTNVFISNILIKLYSSLGLIEDARRVFDGGTELDLFSWNLIISGYVTSGDMKEARILFDRMLARDVVSWSTLIAGYVKVGCYEEAMILFREMQLAGATPNEYTITSTLAACTKLVALYQGRWLHVYMNKVGVKMNEKLLSSVIDMYAKCGEVDFAMQVFHCEEYEKQTVWPWNAMIGGFAMHGRSSDAIQLFTQMELANVFPNEITFLSLLEACSHGLLVKEGRFYFELMSSVYGFIPGIEHYGCLVDVLARAGHLKEAENVILAMPIIPDAIVWGALLNGCRIHRDMERGKKIGKIIVGLEPNHVGCGLLLANMFSDSGKWDDATNIRKNIESDGIKKIPGCSSIELDGTIHQFLVGDRSHPQTREIYSFLDEVAIKLKRAGYIPEIRGVLLDVDEEEKETAVTRHSERLAIAFGLVNSTPGTRIRVVKNLRICWDCHVVTKLISKMYEREIIVRDRIRFHHFKEGLCSCNDSW